MVSCPAVHTVPRDSRIRPSELLSLGLAVAIAALILLTFHDSSWGPADEGNYGHVAERILDGEVLNRDVQDVHAGAINFVNAAAMSIWGRSLVSMRYPLVLLGILGAVGVWLLFRRFGSAWGVVAAAIWTAFGIVLFLNPTAHWYCQGLFLLIVLELQLLPAGSRRRLLLVGATLGALLWFRQLSGVLVGIGVVAYLLCETSAVTAQVGSPPRLRVALTRWSLSQVVVAIGAAGLAGYLLLLVGEPRGILLFGLGPLLLLVLAFGRACGGTGETGRLLGGLAAGLGLVLALPVAYHVAHGSLESWIDDVFGSAVGLAGSDFISTFRHHDVLINGGLATLVSAQEVRHALNAVFWMLLPFAALVQAGWLLWQQRGGRTALAPLPFLAPFYAVIALHYQIPIYLILSLATTMIALLWMALSLPSGPRLAVVLGLTGMGAVAVGYHAGQDPSRMVYDLLDGTQSTQVAVPEIPRLRLRIDPEGRDFYLKLLARIEAETAPGEAIFVAPSSAELYFLSARRNPTRFFNSALGLADATAARELAARLRETPPRLLLYDLGDKYTTPPLREFLTLVSDLYEPLPPIGRFSLMRLRTSVAVPVQVEAEGE